MHTLGILGVGELTEKVVRGLRRSGYAGQIYLSPRNAQQARTLAAECDCQVMQSNQAVVDNAQLVFLGVRPEAVDQVAREVCFKSGQGLLSLVAGVSLERLVRAFPGARCLRVMLSYAVQFNQSTVVLCPQDTASEAVLTPLGNLVVLEDENAFELATVAACMNGWFYFLLHDLQQWLADKGLSAAQARALVLGNLMDCVTSAQQQPEHSLKAMGQAIATPGTFTADGLAMLNHQPVSATWGAACEVVLDALLTRSQLP